MPKLLLSLFALTLALGAGVAGAADFVWIEGESPTSVDLKFKAENSGHDDWLSGGQLARSPRSTRTRSRRTCPPRGACSPTSSRSRRPATYEVWDRIGFEFVRSPFDWRIDGGDWARIGPEALTTDLMELDFFCEVAWLKLGEKALAAGPHTLEIRLPRTKDEKGATARILYASDALCLNPGTFAPDAQAQAGRGRPRRARPQGRRDRLRPARAASAAEQRSRVTPRRASGRSAATTSRSPGEVAEPIEELPETPNWKGIAVPGDKNKLAPRPAVRPSALVSDAGRACRSRPRGGRSASSSRRTT